MRYPVLILSLFYTITLLIPGLNCADKCTQNLKSIYIKSYNSLQKLLNLMAPLTPEIELTCQYEEVEKDNIKFLYVWMNVPLDKFGKICPLIFKGRVENISPKFGYMLNFNTDSDFRLFPASCNYSISTEDSVERKDRLDSLIRMEIEEMIKQVDFQNNDKLKLKLYYISLLGTTNLFNSYIVREFSSYLQKYCSFLYTTFNKLLAKFLERFGKGYIESVKQKIVLLLDKRVGLALFSLVQSDEEWSSHMYTSLIDKYRRLEKNGGFIAPQGNNYTEIILNYRFNRIESHHMEILLKKINFTVNKNEDQRASMNRSFVDVEVSEYTNTMNLYDMLKNFPLYKIRFYILEMLYFRNVSGKFRKMSNKEAKEVVDNCKETPKQQLYLLSEALVLEELEDRIIIPESQTKDKERKPILKCGYQEKNTFQYYSFLVELEGYKCLVGLKYDSDGNYLFLPDTHPTLWPNVSCLRLSRTIAPSFKLI